MTRKIIGCGIIRHELDYITRGKDVDIVYLDPALHTDTDKLERALINAIDSTQERDVPLIIGTRCHPDIEKLAAGRGAKLAQSQNCIEMFLGDKLGHLNSEGFNFYMTAGWLENWRNIFTGAMKWDAVDARQNFGLYDRIIVLDTGLIPLDEEKIIEFYDYTQVPVEIMQVDLDIFREIVSKACEGVL
ncbi:MAG: hypothetical protein JL50_00095 [Peptococcaceae bacterium BICA1-7]|nr:MAG: hypothetical protein JL50_00095 [Peptococcaceae bacterium BICA1-7]HBV98216.1 DUF1638 domain-containing protein [Desulfotomaculum sp.]